VFSHRRCAEATFEYVVVCVQKRALYCGLLDSIAPRAARAFNAVPSRASSRHRPKRCRAGASAVSPAVIFPFLSPTTYPKSQPTRAPIRAVGGNGRP
jgi:hypothetical protein